MYKRLILFFCTLSLGSIAQNVTKLGLEDCLTLAIDKNPQLKQAEMQVESVNNQYQQTKFSLSPSVSGILNEGYSIGRNIDPYSNDVVTSKIGTNNLGIRADWVLFNGFQNKNQLQQQLLTWKATKFDLETVKNNIKLSVLQAYMQVLTTQELLEVANNQASATQLQLEKLEKLVKLNVLPEGHLFDIKGQLSNDKFQIINTRNNLRLAKLNLKQLLHLDINQEIEIEPLAMENIVMTNNNQSEVYQWAAENMPQMKSAQEKIKVQTQALLVTNGMKYPTVTLSGAWGTSYSSVAKRAIFGEDFVESFTNQYVNLGTQKVPVMQVTPNISTQKIGYFEQLGKNNNVSFGLSIRVPIFNSTQLRYRVANNKIQQKIAKYEADNVRVQLQQQIEQAFAYQTNALERWEVVKEQLSILQKALEVAEIKLDKGIINAVDYNITKTNLDKAKISEVQAKYEYLLRQKIIAFYEGK